MPIFEEHGAFNFTLYDNSVYYEPVFIHGTSV